MLLQASKIFSLVALALVAGTASAIPSRVIIKRDYNSGAPNEDDIAELLAAHNDFRALYGVSDLSWDEDMASGAQDWADSCQIFHSDTEFGENLVTKSPPSSATLTQLVKVWTNEASLYDYDNPGFSMATGHFTQVVWASATTMGCGHATCNNKSYLVCRYDDGNSGDYENQVPRLL